MATLFECALILNEKRDSADNLIEAASIIEQPFYLLAATFDVELGDRIRPPIVIGADYAAVPDANFDPNNIRQRRTGIGGATGSPGSPGKMSVYTSASQVRR